MTGSQQDYNRMCREMPQHLRIAYFHQQEMPLGFDSGAFGGAWPAGIVTVKGSLKSESYFLLFRWCNSVESTCSPIMENLAITFKLAYK